VECKPIAQFEAVGLFVRRDLVIADHLWPRYEFGIDREQSVEHHVAMIARDVGGRPDRVENSEIGLRNKA